MPTVVCRYSCVLRLRLAGLSRDLFNRDGLSNRRLTYDERAQSDALLESIRTSLAELASDDARLLFARKRRSGTARECARFAPPECQRPEERHRQVEGSLPSILV